MRTSFLIVIVVVLHCVAIGSLFFIQGCGTTATTERVSATPVMPPPRAPEAVPAKAKPAVVPKSIEKAKPAETAIYIVQSGDSVSKIAKRFNIRQTEIVELNKMSDPNRIRIGQKLLLPGYVDVTKPAPKRPKKAPAAKQKPVKSDVSILSVQEVPGVYIVQAGDSLSKIAARFGTKVSAIKNANKLQSDKILVGQKLLIPGSEERISTEKGAVAGETTSVIIEEGKGSFVGSDITLEPFPATTTVTGIIHVVQPDESMNSIAKLYAVTIEELAEINNLASTDTVKPGQRLKIP